MQSTLKRKVFAPLGANSFLYELTPIAKGGKNENDRVTPPECTSNPFNYSPYQELQLKIKNAKLYVPLLLLDYSCSGLFLSVLCQKSMSTLSRVYSCAKKIK